jgi:serine/threonine-protein kinase RsbW
MADTTIRFMKPDESALLTELITAAYGSTYDAQWVYQPTEIARRITSGELISIIGIDAQGQVLGHTALMKEGDDSLVLHSGAAVVSEAARGQHLFTQLKSFGADWARESGYFGLFSEATAAHPFSQKANVDLGAKETGFLIGWIPPTVVNNAALATIDQSKESRRESVALFYLKTNDGHDRPMYAPRRHDQVITELVAAAGLRGVVTEADASTVLPKETKFVITAKEDHNLAIITVTEPGRDFAHRVMSHMQLLMDRDGRSAVYLDLPLEHPGSALVLDQHDLDLPFAFGGIFPNLHVSGDVLRLTALNGVELHPHDIASASDHGRELLEYVLADLDRTGANRN